jgi:HPt (histidine-containing phosphotransfer) domain-containing protein
VGAEATENVVVSNPVPLQQLPAENNLCALSGFDLNNVLDMLGGSEEILLEVLCAFREDLKTTLSEIDLQLSENKLIEAGNLVHRVKGTAGNLGAKELYTVAAKLEALFKQEKLDTATYELFRKIVLKTQLTLDGLNCQN